MDAKDQAVFDQFTRVTGIPYPMSIDAFLPPGGLFTSKIGGFAGIGVMLLLGWWGKKKAEEEENERSEAEQFRQWRESRVSQ